MTIERTKHVRFLPWENVPLGLTCRVTRASYDADRPAVILPDRHLIEADEPFERLALELEVIVPHPVTAAVAEPGAPLGLVVAIRCDDTRLRRGIVLPVPAKGDALTHRLVLQRKELAGSVELATTLIRRTPRPDDGSALATRAFAALSTARPWEVRIDRKRSLGGIYLDVRYASFRDDPVVPAGDKHNLYRLELEGPAPVLWLNSDHRSVTSVMNSRAQSGRTARLREVAFDLVVPAVWTQLFLRAAPAVLEDPSGAPEWQQAVVGQVLRLLYGAKVGEDEAQTRLRAELEDLPTLLGQLDAALQRHHGLGAHLEAVAEEVST